MIKKFKQALLAIDRQQTAAILAQAAKKSGPVAAIEAFMVPALEDIGEGWHNGEVSLSQVYMAGRICEELIHDILPDDARRSQAHPPMAIALLEDYHMLGKRLVSSTLTANGYTVMDYGRVNTEELVSLVDKDGIEILFISALMLPSALHVGKVVKLLAQRGCNVKIIAGGAPFRMDSELIREVGAYATADYASAVPGLIRQIMEESR